MLRTLRLPEDDAMSSCGAGFFAEPMDVTLQCSALSNLVLPYVVANTLETVVGIPALQRLHISPSASFRNRVYHLKQADEATLRGPNINFQSSHGRFDWTLKDIGAPIKALVVRHIPHHWSLLIGQDSLASLQICRVPRRTRKSDVKRYQRPPAFFMGKGLERLKLNFLPDENSFCESCPNLKVLQIETDMGHPKPFHCRMEEPLHVRGLPNLTSLVLQCPWHCFSISLDLPALIDFQLSMYCVTGTLTLICPQLRTWTLKCGAGPPPVKDWNLELDKVHTVKCNLKAEATFAGEDGGPSVIKWLPLFQLLPRLHHLEIVLDASAEHGETPERLRRIFLETDLEGSEPSLREFEARQRQHLSLNSPTATVVKLLVKQRLTWGYNLEKLTLPSCVQLTTDILLTRDPAVFGEDEEIIQLPRLRELHLMEVPNAHNLDDRAALTKALVRRMPLLHLLAFEAPQDCKLGEWLPETSKIASLATCIWQEKPHLRVTVGGRDVEQQLNLTRGDGYTKIPIRMAKTSPSLSADGGTRSEPTMRTPASSERSKLREHAKSFVFDRSGSGLMAGKDSCGLESSSRSTASAGDLKARLSFMRTNDGRKPSSVVSIHKRRASSICTDRLSLVNVMIEESNVGLFEEDSI